MKSRRLTETDLANMAFQSIETKKLRIANLLKPKPIEGSYEPFRSTIGEALNVQFPFLLEERPATPIEVFEAIVARACRGDAQLLAMNLTVARSTYLFANENRLSAEGLSAGLLTLSAGHKYGFGLPLIIRSEGKAYVVFPDLRRTQGLTAKGCHVIFSWMHQRYRVNNPDFRMLGLQIWRYANNRDRSIQPVVSLEAGLIGYEQLLTDVEESYAIMHALMREQEVERRRREGGAGPLFGT